MALPAGSPNSAVGINRDALGISANQVNEGKAPLQKVFAVNEHARRAGIEPGMTKLQGEACAGVALRNRSPLQEAAAHAALYG